MYTLYDLHPLSYKTKSVAYSFSSSEFIVVTYFWTDISLDSAHLDNKITHKWWVNIRNTSVLQLLNIICRVLLMWQTWNNCQQTEWWCNAQRGTEYASWSELLHSHKKKCSSHYGECKTCGMEWNKTGYKPMWLINFHFKSEARIVNASAQQPSHRKYSHNLRFPSYSMKQQLTLYLQERKKRIMRVMLLQWSWTFTIQTEKVMKSSVVSFRVYEFVALVGQGHQLFVGDSDLYCWVQLNICLKVDFWGFWGMTRSKGLPDSAFEAGLASVRTVALHMGTCSTHWAMAACVELNIFFYQI